MAFIFVLIVFEVYLQEFERCRFPLQTYTMYLNPNTLVVINVCINSKPTKITLGISIPNKISHSG